MDLTITLTPEQLAEIADRVAQLLSRRETSSHDGYLDAVGAAEYLATSKDRVYDLVQLGKLEPHRDGRRLLFRRADLDAYIESQT